MPSPERSTALHGLLHSLCTLWGGEVGLRGSLWSPSPGRCLLLPSCILGKSRVQNWSLSSLGVELWGPLLHPSLAPSQLLYQLPHPLAVAPTPQGRPVSYLSLGPLGIQVTQSFMPQTIIENLLCVKHCSRHWGHSCKQNSPCPH